MARPTSLATGVWQAHRWAIATNVCLFVGIAAATIVAFAVVGEYSLIHQVIEGVTPPEFTIAQTDATYAVASRFQLLAFCATGFCWLTWLPKAYHNLRLTGSGETKYSPGWAMGYWFIPFVNLVRPYQLMAETWRRTFSGNAPDSQSVTVPGLIGLWWATYLIAMAVTRVATNAIQDSQMPTDLLGAFRLDVIGCILMIVAALLAHRMIKAIDTAQHDWRKPAPEAALAQAA